jgi:hypothetical protein
MQNRDKILQITIAVIVIILHLFLPFSDENLVLNWFITDDAFYYFKIAQNIVEGKGISFDGITITNGFHPLWMIVLLPIFTLGRYNLIIPLRIIIGLQTILAVFAAIITYRLCRRKISATISFLTALTWVLYPSLHEVTHKGGTEGGLNAFLIPLLWAAYVKVTESASLKVVNKWGLLGLGGLASLTLFTRLDNVFLVFILGIGLIFSYWKESPFRIREVLSTWKQWGIFIASYYLPIIVSLGVYMVGSKLYFGSEMPISGKIKRWWSTLKYTVYDSPPDNVKGLISEIFSTAPNTGPWSIIIAPYNSLRDRLLGFVGVTADTRSTQLASILYLVLFIGLLVFLVYKNWEWVGHTFKAWNLGILLLACCVHIAYYKITGQSAQKSWYWITEGFGGILLVAILFEMAYRMISSLKFGNWVASAGVIVLIAGLITPHANMAVHAINYQGSTEPHFYLKRALWLEENTAPGSLIGMTGSGSTGYFVRDRVIVNLDGLANSVDYFIHLQKATADHYLADLGLDYVFGNPDTILRSNPYAWNFPDRLDEWKYYVMDEKTLVLFTFK